MKEKIFLLVLFIFLILAILFTADNFINLEKCKIARVQKLLQDEKYIIHAGGFISDVEGNTYTYSNSKEALLNLYNNGNKFCEIDFQISTDGQLVCIHEWKNLFINNQTLTKATDLKTFLDGKIYNQFTPIWLGNIVDFIKEHEDFYIITDVKDDNINACKIIADYCPDLLDNFIIQIYHENEYNQITSLGFNNIIYTLYNTTSEEKNINALQTFAKNNPIIGFAFWNFWADNSTFLSALKETNVPLFIHTVNDTDLQKKYFDIGITAIYTDNVYN